jgi:hypothetical protein
MMLFTAKFNRPVSGGTYSTPVVATLSIDKRTGKRLRDREDPNYPPHSQGQFYALAVDRRAGTYDLIAHNLKLRHYIAEPGMKNSSGGDTVGKNSESAPQAAEEVRPIVVPQRLIPVPPPPVQVRPSGSAIPPRPPK